MDHSAAKLIFNEIRDRPYEWVTVPNKPAQNCYFKGIELLQRLGILGYAVRGQVGETQLDDLVPESIRDLYPHDFELSHFWVEVLLDGHWHTLDPSFDALLLRGGLPVTEWESNSTCFEIIKTYTQEEIIAKQNEWNNADFTHRYFKAVAPCALALNRWYQMLRTQTI